MRDLLPIEFLLDHENGRANQCGHGKKLRSKKRRRLCTSKPYRSHDHSPRSSDCRENALHSNGRSKSESFSRGLWIACPGFFLWSQRTSCSYFSIFDRVGLAEGWGWLFLLTKLYSRECAFATYHVYITLQNRTVLLITVQYSEVSKYPSERPSVTQRYTNQPNFGENRLVGSFGACGTAFFLYYQGAEPFR